MKVRFLGGTREVGRSALHVTTERAKILLDYGVMLARPPGFPMHVKPKDVDAIAMSHCHLDHSGAIPVFHLHKKIPVFGTRLSFDLVQVLISDFIHLSGYYLPFEYIELQTMLRSCVSLDYKEPRVVGDAQIQLLDAGHLPGSAQVLVEAEGKRLLYTSDYNLTETRLLHGADKDYGELDALIIESTYADEDRSSRKRRNSSCSSFRRWTLPRNYLHTCSAPFRSSSYHRRNDTENQPNNDEPHFLFTRPPPIHECSSLCHLGGRSARPKRSTKEARRYSISSWDVKRRSCSFLRAKNWHEESKCHISCKLPDSWNSRTRTVRERSMCY